MVFEDKNLKRSYPRPQGVKYTKSQLELNDLFSRVASDETSYNAGQEILEKYGYSKANSPSQLAHKLSAIVLNAGEPALKDIANIHPDKDLILAQCAVAPEPVIVTKEIIKEVPAPSKSSSQHDCGCGGHNSAEGDTHDCGCGGHHSAEGHTHHHAKKYGYAEGGFAEAKPEENKYLKPVLLLSLTALVIAVIYKA